MSCSVEECIHLSFISKVYALIEKIKNSEFSVFCSMLVVSFSHHFLFAPFITTLISQCK